MEVNNHMEKCIKCGEWIDYTNPNIHYGGHTCNTIIEPPKNISSEISEIVDSTIPSFTITWKDVFDGYKLFPEPWDVVVQFLKPTSYRYVAFNGWVYPVNAKSLDNPICLETDLIQGFTFTL